MSAIVTLSGVRIEKSNFYNNKHYTIVSSPAPDEFSYPSKFRVTSEQALGNPGMMLNIKMTMKGVVKPKTYLDPQTGQQKNYDESDVYFDVIESSVFVPKTDKQ